MFNRKSIIAMLLLLLLLFVSGCGTETSGTTHARLEASGSKVHETQDVQTNTKPITPENDTQVGLKNIKIDSTDRKLTDEQKAVVKYFDNDYLMPYSYEFIRRYPNIFQNAQLSVEGVVVKVLSMDNDNYEIVIWMDANMIDDPYGTPGAYVILNGNTDPAMWFMEGDVIYIDGRYTGIKTVEIDGTSYTIPTVDVHNTYFSIGRPQFRAAQKFDYEFIKIVAEAIFGKDIEIRDPVAGEDLSMDAAMMDTYAFGGIMPYEGMDPSEFVYTDLVVELEDQSNANFKKFRFSMLNGMILDAKGPFDSGIERQIEFSADFEHYFMFTYNQNFEALTLAYYDKNFNKIWEREFEDTTSAVYDYTENNLYIVVNNELYVINIMTGEDTFEPAYVGDKKEIRKDNDGIVMVSANKSDGIMKVSLDGGIIWKTNLSADVEYVEGVQFVDGNIILNYRDTVGTTYYMLIDGESGEPLIDAMG